MKKLLLALLLLLPTASYAQSVKGPVNAQFFFTPTDVANTDYYELCLAPGATSCERLSTTEAVTELTFNKTYNDGPYQVAVRACNAAACSALSNAVQIPKIVLTGPNKPDKLRIVITIVQP